MDYSWFSVVICNLLLTVVEPRCWSNGQGKSTLSANVDVQPSPIATITEGAVLWLTCTYDLDGGTLGQLQWKVKDSSNVVTATPTSTPPCSSVSPDNYSVDCNLASNEVRLGILNPVHGDTYSCSVYLSDFTLIGQVSVVVKLSASVDVQPSPVATVTDGAVLWLTCMYDLNGGTLGQLQWKDKDGGIVATATPTSTPPCSTVFPDSYSVDCNLASNEVRLGILNPVHGDAYNCSVYLSDSTLIGPVSTQVSVVVPVTSVTFTFPVNDTVTVTPGGSQVYMCVTGSCRPPARIEWYNDGVNVTTQTGSVSSVGDKFVTTSIFTLTGTKGDSPATIQCRALNMDGMTPVQSGVKMFIVEYVPDIVISPLDNPYIIKENQTNVTLTCAVTSTIPPVTSILWRRESVLVSSTGIYSIPVVNRDTSGVYTCYATNDAGTSTANITLQVLLIPLVPHLLGITDVTSSSISIKLALYDPNSLAINITYTCFGCVAKKWMYVDLTDVQNTYVTTLTNLLPNTQYNLAVTAENRAGSSNQLRIIVSTSSANEFSSPPSYTSTAPSTALIVVAVACIIVGLIACGTGAILYRNARVTGRSGNRQNQLAKPEAFSDVMATGSGRDMENDQDSSHYQELQQYDIGKPSIYDHITQADNSGTLGMERDRNDSQQQPSDHDYSNAI